jgi:hypothetical protein
MTLSPAAKAHLDQLVPTIQGLNSYDYDKRREMFREGYEFARKEIWEIIKRDWQPRNKPMFASPEEYFATFNDNQPQPEGE